MSKVQQASGSSSKPMEPSLARPGATVTEHAALSATNSTASSISPLPYPAAKEASKAGASSGEAMTGDGKTTKTTTQTKKKESKKRKVGQACVYCRRSHMTCDSQRPCTRCIKRDIGNLCHDEAPGKGHGHAHHAVPKNKPNSSGGTSDATSQSPITGSSSPSGPTQSAHMAPLPSLAKGPAPMSPPPVPAAAQSRRPSAKRLDSGTASGVKGDHPLFFHGQNTLSSAPAAITTGAQSNSGQSVASFLQSNRQVDAMQAYIAAMQTDPSSTADTVRALYTSRSGQAGPSLIEQPMLLRPSGDGGRGGRQTLGGQSSDALGSLVSGNVASPSSASLVAPLTLSPPMAGSLGPYASSNGSWPISSTSATAAGLGGAGFLGLGGSHGLAYGTEGRGGDIAGGNEFNLLSEFLESLDGPGDAMLSTTSTAVESSSTTALGGDAFAPSLASPTTRKDATPVLEKQTPWAPSEKGQGTNHRLLQSPTTVTARGTKRPHTTSDNVADADFSDPLHSNNNAPSSSAIASSSSSDPAKLKGFATSTKTERFFLTAADQVDGPRDERLTKVIQAKYDAGLLRPYNHVKGYARLNSWMDSHVSPSSRRRILKPLSVFRPRFRAVAQSLSDVDLIYIEEAFERLLLDYDRVFSTQGIPACLWRRTGEIYKGNREFAELVGVGPEELREGRLCIYELMEEESACNYWEKYGAVSFDPGQKAVLTSCVLTPRPHRWHPNGTSTAPASSSVTPRGNADRTSVTGAVTAGNHSGTLTSGASGGARPLSESLSSSANKKRPGDRGQSPNASNSESGNEEDGSTHVEGGRPKHVHCCFSFTIRRDRFGVPTAVVGNFLPIS